MTLEYDVQIYHQASVVIHAHRGFGEVMGYKELDLSLHDEIDKDATT